MELLAFTQSAVFYEDATVDLEPVSLDAVQGRLSRSFWTGLLSASAVLAAFCIQPKAALAELRPGDTGTNVESLQLALAAANYYTGEVTGFYGALTEKAVYDFQRDRGFSADGIAGSETLQALSLNPALSSGNGGGGGVSSSSVISSSYNTSSYSTSSSSYETVSGGGGGSSIDTLDTSSSVRFVTNTPTLSGINRRGVVKTVYGVGINVRSQPAGTIVDGKPDGAVVIYDPNSAIDEAGYTWVQITEGGRWVARQYLIDSGGGGGGGQGGTYRVIALNGATVYDRPNGLVIGSLSRGTAVSLMGEDVFNGGLIWGQLTASRGWVVKDGLALIVDNDRVSAGGYASRLRAQVLANALIVRDAPAGNDTGIALIQGEIVALSGLTEERAGRTWAELANGNWVAADFLQFI
jgi:peptidoglycan hydrolase-like protein with peptidoglycan-binding domain